MDKVLVIGCNGQLGSELAQALSERYGLANVVGADIHDPEGPFQITFERIDATDIHQLEKCIKKHDIKVVFHLAAVLSAKAELEPVRSWDINMKSLVNVLELGRLRKVNKIFWPGSIAMFGPNTPKNSVQQVTITDPNTSYGISKLAGELWCGYYIQHFNVDVRSVRYPGIISYKTKPGGGTTDYAIEIFRAALEKGRYTCYLEGDTRLPMMYIDDAVRAAVEIMEAPLQNLTVRTGYNVAGVSFGPAELALEIEKHVPGFTVDYQADYRQEIARSWPSSINDEQAACDWGWEHKFNLEKITEIMLKSIREETNE